MALPILEMRVGRSIEELVDTSTAAGKAFLDLPGVFTTFDADLCRERQLEN
jgi:hypothetical protein